MEEKKHQDDLEELPAADGAGTLLQRDYWVAIEQSKLSPNQILDLLASEFPRFAAHTVAEFSFSRIPPLKEGDEMKIHILGYGDCHVRVSQREARTLTLVTLEDHYEAGRVTFGAFLTDSGQTILKIRSRARSRSKRHALSFLILGHIMQKQMWSQFLSSLARECYADSDSSGSDSSDSASEKFEIQVQEETQPVEEENGDAGEEKAATFTA